MALVPRPAGLRGLAAARALVWAAAAAPAARGVMLKAPAPAPVRPALLALRWAHKGRRAHNASQPEPPGADLVFTPGTDFQLPVPSEVLVAIFLLIPCVVFLVRKGASARSTGTASEDADMVRRQGSFRAIDQGTSVRALFMGQGSGDTVREVLSGAVVSLGCLPEAISFSMIAGMSPLNGIWAGVFLGMYSSLMGGRPGMISCSSGATAVVLAPLVRTHGIGPMSISVLIVGLFQLLAGVLRLSRFIALVPHPVMLGFVNGLAVVIARSQLEQFRTEQDGPFVEPVVMQGMVLTIVVSMVTAVGAPRLPVVGKFLPGPLAAMVCAIAFSYAISPWFPPRTLADVASLPSGFESLPTWSFPPAGVDWSDTSMWADVIMTACRMGLVGLVESLLTVKLLDQLTGTPGSTTQECFGQGFGNIVCGLFGTQGGCALIGQSLINVSGGGTGRLSSFIMSAGLFCSVVVATPLVSQLPTAALVGLMFLVALNTFAWGSLGLCSVISKIDALVIVVVTVVTILVDLASAVLLGLFVSALAFAWTAAKDVKLADGTEGADGEVRVFRLQGPLFFGSAMSFQDRIKPDKVLEKQVVLDFSSGQVLDHSALEAITKTTDTLREAGKQVKFRALPPEAAAYFRSTSTARNATIETAAEPAGKAGAAAGFPLPTPLPGPGVPT